MRPGDAVLGNRLRRGLAGFKLNGRLLPIAHQPDELDCLVEQLVESVRRNNYIRAIKARPISPVRLDPHSRLFDPYKAALLQQRANNIDEAFWLVFQATHFGKHLEDNWSLFRDVYGRLGQSPIWSWSEITAKFDSFETWFDAHLDDIKGLKHRFSNHRQYQSIANTKRVFRSYIDWIGGQGGHANTISHAVRAHQNGPPREVFDYLFNEMSSVYQFARLGKFDFLCMLGKLGLAPIEPGSTYMAGATGPYQGARLLLGERSRRECETLLQELDETLQVGMQALEDALCNWQKSPRKFIAFRG